MKKPSSSTQKPSISPLKAATTTIEGMPTFPFMKSVRQKMTTKKQST